MEKAYLYQRLPFLKDVKKDRREQFERYFQTAPLWGADRLALLFVDYFEQYGQGGVLWVREGQKSLADKTGFCLKSVNRAVKKLSEQGLIEKQGNQIKINQEQYERMKAQIAEKLDIN